MSHLEIYLVFVEVLALDVCSMCYTSFDEAAFVGRKACVLSDCTGHTSSGVRSAAVRDHSSRKIRSSAEASHSVSIAHWSPVKLQPAGQRRQTSCCCHHRYRRRNYLLSCLLHDLSHTLAPGCISARHHHSSHNIGAAHRDLDRTVSKLGHHLPDARLALETSTGQASVIGCSFIYASAQSVSLSCATALPCSCQSTVRARMQRFVPALPQTCAITRTHL